MKVITFWGSFYDTNVFYSAMGTLCRGSVVRFHSGDLHPSQKGIWFLGRGGDGWTENFVSVCLSVSVCQCSCPSIHRDGRGEVCHSTDRRRYMCTLKEVLEAMTF